MHIFISKILKKWFSVFTVIVIISCDDGSSTIMQINQFNENPIGIAYDIRMTYTDSAVVKAILTAPVNFDFTHLSFKYSEFPEGLKIIFFNSNKLSFT